MMQPVERLTMTGQVYSQLRQMLLYSEVRPGTLLTIRGLAERAKASVTPVREALSRLIAERALELIANREIRVPILGVARAKEIVELRALLEGNAAAQSAEHVTSEEIDRLEATHEKFVRAVRAGDIDKLLRLNRDFRSQLYEGSKNETLIPLIDSLWLQYAPTLRIIMEHSLSAKRPGDSLLLYGSRNDLYLQTLKALRKRDSAAARDAIVADTCEPTKLPGFWDAISGTAHKGEGSAQHRG